MKRKLATTIAVVFVLSLAALAQAPAAATKIAVLDLQQAILATNEGQRDFAELQKKFEPKRNEIQTASAEIEKLKKQLADQEKLMNDESRSKLMKEIDTKQKLLQRNYEDAQNDMGGQQNEIFTRIVSKMSDVVKKYATDNGYAVVLNPSSGGDQSVPAVLWASPSADITKAVVDAYNAQSGVPAPAAAATAPKAAAPAAAKPAAPAAKKP